MAAIQSPGDNFSREPGITQPPPVAHATDSFHASSSGNAAAQAERLEAEKVHLLYTHSTIAALITLVLGAILLVLLLWPVVSHARLLAWVGFMFAVALIRWLLVCHYRRRARSGDLTYWRTLLFVSVGVTGCGWGLAGFFLFPTYSLPHQVFLVTFLGGVSIISIANLAVIRPLFALFFSSLMGPIALRFILSGESISMTMSLLCLSFSGCLALIAYYIHTSVVESLRLRFVNLDLVQHLSAAKEQAEQARLQLAASHAALRKNEERFRSLIEHAADVVTVLNADETIRYISPSIEPWLGYSTAELIGRPFTITLLHPTDQEKVSAHIRACVQQSEGEQTFESRWHQKEGTWRSVESVIRNLFDDNAVAGITLSSRDVTARKEVERLKDELVSAVSHELRTPLTSLRGFTELMLTRNFPLEQQRRFLTIMNDETTRLTDLINDFLDLQRIESGRQTYVFTDVALLPLLQSALTPFANVTEKHTFYLNTPASLPPVRADSGRIRQVLTNLLSNAIKFSPDGGIITISARDIGDSIEVRITDDGIGIPTEAIPQLFEKFFRVDNTETRKISGTGLGLALVKQIIRAHGGWVRVESAPGKGSTFSFSLPVGV